MQLPFKLDVVITGLRRRKHTDDGIASEESLLGDPQPTNLSTDHKASLWVMAVSNSSKY
jgi:hypothetical protein